MEVAVAKMKCNPFVTYKQSKNHKRHFNAPSHIHMNIMFFPLSEELRQNYNFWSMSIQKDDEVQVVWGHHKGPQIGDVVQVYREKMWHLHWTYAARETNDTTAHVSIQPRKVVVTGLKLDKDSKRILECKAKSHQGGKRKGKYKEETTEKM